MEKENVSYERIPILEAARRCGVNIDYRTIDRKEVEAVCPFCGDKPRRRHFSMNTSTDKFFCQLCGIGGNSVSLYAKLRSIPNAEAARELLDGGNLYQFPLPPPRAVPQEREPKPLTERHDAYGAMLRHLTLNERHWANLRERGLSDERISRNMYRTLPGDESARRLLAGMLADFHDLDGIPGFGTGKDGRWTIPYKGGLLIPVRDRGGFIQGLQIRLDDDDLEDNKRRYRWLSSNYLPKGTKGGAWIHVTGDVTSKTAILTEGPLKGDAASYHDGDALFICIAGINATERLTGVIRSLGVTEILLAADMDKVVNKQVRDSFDRITRDIRQMGGVRVTPLNWDVSVKGIDDFYLMRRKAKQRGQNMTAKRNSITDHLLTVWQREYPHQDAGWIGSCEWMETVRPLNELIVGKPKDIIKAQVYKHAMDAGQRFSPVVVVNDMVIDGLHRCWAHAQRGEETVRVYQNKPFALREAA